MGFASTSVPALNIRPNRSFSSSVIFAASSSFVISRIAAIASFSAMAVWSMI